MSLTGNNGLLAAAGANQPVYDIPYSIKTAGTSERISRTMTSTGAATPHFTYSTWYKKTQPVILAHLLWWQCKAIHTNAVVALSMPVDPEFRFNLWTGSASEADRYSAEKYRDPAAWMHIVMQWNGATFAIYVNNVLVNMDTSGNINGNSWGLQTGNIMRVSSADHGDGDGYTADTHFIEGQTLAPSNFAELNEDTGQWVPKEYEGTYSGNSFRLDYADSSDLGKDVSGLGNHFTVSGGIDANSQVLDSPTNNFATLNPLAPALHGAGPVQAVITEGNLKHTGVSSTYVHEILTQAVSSGKWYVEFCVNTLSTDSNMFVGVGNEAGVITDRSNPEANTKSVALQANGQAWKDGNTTTSHSSGAYGTVGHIVGISLNLDDNEVKFFVNNSAFTLTTSITGGGDLWTFWVLTYNTEAVTLNAGQDSSFAGAKTAQGNQDGNGYGDFYYTPPAGHLALCTNNLAGPAIDLPSDHFNTVLYTGDGTTNHAITGVGFQPDFVWYKQRAGTGHHNVYDSVRGVQKVIYPNLANAEATSTGTQDLYAFGADGFTVGSNFQTACNTSGETFASWNWKAGGAASSNSDGSTTSSVSANTTAGFSIVSYAGSGSAGATVGHGLSQTPDLIMIKNRTGITNWVVNSPIIDSTFVKWAMKLDITEAISADTTIWNSTAPSASVFTLGTAGESNRNNPDNYIAYCFHSVEGYSKVGKYTGNGNADGSFVYTGFRPMWVMAKCTDGTASWLMTDSVRQPYNVTDDPLFANENSAETNSSTYAIDILSNGFKCRGVNNDTNNSDGNVYIYLAFAESPFKYANAR